MEQLCSAPLDRCRKQCSALAENPSYTEKLDKHCQDLTFRTGVCKVTAPVTMVTWQLRWWDSRRGTAYPREMTHSWCRNNFSCREDTPYLLRPGRGHVLVPGATDGCWLVLHMALMVPLQSQHRLRTSPTHLLLRGSGQSGSPCCFHFLLYRREHRAARKKRHPGRLQATA